MFDPISKKEDTIKSKTPQPIIVYDVPSYNDVEMDEMKELSEDFEPGPFDVICARGKAAPEHIGNRRFRSNLERNLSRYSESTSKQQKSVIVKSILQSIREASPNGGFVKQIEGKWYEVGDHIAREKVGQGFRDLLHDQYRSSTKSKVRRRREKQNEKFEEALKKKARLKQEEIEQDHDIEPIPLENKDVPSSRSTFSNPYIYNKSESKYPRDHHFHGVPHRHSHYGGPSITAHDIPPALVTPSWKHSQMPLRIGANNHSGGRTSGSMPPSWKPPYSGRGRGEYGTSRMTTTSQPSAQRREGYPVISPVRYSSRYASHKATPFWKTRLEEQNLGGRPEWNRNQNHPSIHASSTTRGLSPPRAAATGTAQNRSLGGSNSHHYHHEHHRSSYQQPPLREAAESNISTAVPSMRVKNNATDRIRFSLHPEEEDNTSRRYSSALLLDENRREPKDGPSLFSGNHHPGMYFDNDPCSSDSDDDENNTDERKRKYEYDRGMDRYWRPPS